MMTPDTQAEDARLLRQVALQNRSAFGALYDRYAGQVYGIAHRILEDRAASEDVVQEAFLRLWRQSEHLDAQRGNVRNWLLSLAHRMAIDALRRKRAKRMVEFDHNTGRDVAGRDGAGRDGAGRDGRDGPVSPWTANEDEWDMPGDDANAQEEAHPDIPRQRVRQALAALPEPNRRVIELAFFSGLTHREIAERLGEPLDAVHSRARQAMTLLRHKLPELRLEPELDE